MKVAGIITEYNPFHNGHKLHIDETRRVTGADYVIAVMSGNFVQRGAPAILDKYSRAKMALNNGVDIVLELPVCYATGSAEYFALG
ncbi:MAG TPA: nucleotidyltransferase family protein, partial [Mobilitalea sp.]|nr:nucleotidyltransferase family protein [Mobilitalea sp.]